MENVILANEIRTAFTNKVNEYLAKGMEINVGTMSGTSGEISRIDVTDGKYIYRIKLDRDYMKVAENDYDFRTHTVNLTVEKFENKRAPALDTFAILWGGEGELVEEKIWYSIDDRKAFVDTIENAKRHIELREARLQARRNDRREVVTDPARLALIYKLVKKQRGYATTPKKNILKVTREGNRYYVYFTADSKKRALYIHA